MQATAVTAIAWPLLPVLEFSRTQRERAAEFRLHAAAWSGMFMALPLMACIATLARLRIFPLPDTPGSAFTRIRPHRLIEQFRPVRQTASIRSEPEESGVRVEWTFDAENAFPPEQQQQVWQATLDSVRRHVGMG